MSRIEKNVIDAVNQLKSDVETLKKYNAGADALEKALIKAEILHSIVTDGVDEENASLDYFDMKEALEYMLDILFKR
ncbi:hypothetical protein [Bacillus subtilis]|uniref:hypothetical protein n=1 Tax=Bacillus subtilis TaxID=1423 RepID=UPI00084A2466|nr:hypothetical protein [Bacillus subtilis]ODV47934.1 hypothetical protein BCM26_05870 [Bacillus subtilis]OJH63532.1 hypothetical protein BOH71_09815 [Bacillus subtilis]